MTRSRGSPSVARIDQEGGRVSRLRLIGEEPPNAQQLREKGEVVRVELNEDNEVVDIFPTH